MEQIELNDDKFIVNPYDMEDRCVAIRSRTCYIFCYPICPEVLRTGCKVLTKDGRIVRKVRTGKNEGREVYVGILDGEELMWDVAGRYDGPYKDSPLDLVVPERYWYKDWRKHMAMSYAEWDVKFGVKHPTVKLPE